MESIIKKTTVLSALIVAAVMLASLASADNAPSDVASSVHNFAYGGKSNLMTASNTGVTEVCVFCHTPHSAAQNKLLWNKVLSNSTFRLYTSSPTLTSAARKSSLPAGSPSLLCLSCHDGKTAMNVLHNVRYGNASVISPGFTVVPVNTLDGPNTGEFPMPGPLPDIYGDGTSLLKSNIIASGDNFDDLTRSHPIGFSYTAALAEKTAKGNLGLHTEAEVKSLSSSKIRFFSSDNRLECSSCHDPHLYTEGTDSNAQKPFLVQTVNKSALCLSCHNK